MNWMELLDESPVFFEAVCNLEEPEYSQLQEVLTDRLDNIERSVSQQVIDGLAEIQKEIDTLKAARSALVKKVYEVILKGVTKADGVDDG